jgi:hypothetical protein
MPFLHGMQEVTSSTLVFSTKKSVRHCRSGFFLFLRRTPDPTWDFAQAMEFRPCCGDLIVGVRMRWWWAGVVPTTTIATPGTTIRAPQVEIGGRIVIIQSCDQYFKPRLLSSPLS